LLTIAANLWPRELEEYRFPVAARLYQTEPGVQVLVHSQQPRVPRIAHAVLVHGLEGSSDSPYMRGMARTLLEAGCAVDRFNLRTCGGTEFLCDTLYHGGLTSDLFAWLMDLDRRRQTPVWLIGFSLGGNIALKLVGEMAEDARRILHAVCAISAPIDLAACARRIGERQNRLYEWRFLNSMKRRLALRQKVLPSASSSVAAANAARTLWEFDDRVTAPAFGFAGAEHYYATQSSIGVLDRIRIPSLLIQAKDDPLIPFEVFERAPLRNNPRIQLTATEHGGHVGFLARDSPHHWADQVVRDWIVENK
jgi:predicted alpha/beta-fold hydrolase